MPDHYEIGAVRFNPDHDPPRWEKYAEGLGPFPHHWVPLSDADNAFLAPYDAFRQARNSVFEEFHVRGGGPLDWVSYAFAKSGQPLNQAVLNGFRWQELGMRPPPGWPAHLAPPYKLEVVDIDESGNEVHAPRYDPDKAEQLLEQFRPRAPERYSTEQVFDGEQAEAYGAKPGGKATVTFNPDGTVADVQLIEPTRETINGQIEAAFTAGDYERAATLEAYRRAVFADAPRDVAPSTYTAANGQQFLVSASGTLTPLADPALERHRLQLEEIQSGYQTEIARHQANSKRSTDNLLFDLFVAGDFEKAERVQRVLNPIDPLRVLSVMSDFADNPEALKVIFDYLDGFGRSDEIAPEARQMVEPQRAPDPPPPASDLARQRVTDPTGFVQQVRQQDPTEFTGTPPGFSGASGGGASFIGAQNPQAALQAFEQEKEAASRRLTPIDQGDVALQQWWEQRRDEDARRAASQERFRQATGPTAFIPGGEQLDFQDQSRQSFIPGGEQNDFEGYAHQPPTFQQFGAIPQPNWATLAPAPSPLFAQASAQLGNNGIVPLYIDGAYTPTHADQAAGAVAKALREGKAVHEARGNEFVNLDPNYEEGIVTFGTSGPGFRVIPDDVLQGAQLATPDPTRDVVNLTQEQFDRVQGIATDRVNRLRQPGSVSIVNPKTGKIWFGSYEDQADIDHLLSRYPGFVELDRAPQSRQQPKVPTFGPAQGSSRNQRFQTFQETAQTLKQPEPPVTFSGQRSPFGAPRLAR